MTSRNRKTLKNYFSNGQLPTQDHFADLIDSMLNMSDEGFRKTVDNGEEIYAPVGHEALLSFYRDQDPQTLLWRFALNGVQNQLRVQTQEGTSEAPLLCLDRSQRVGIGLARPGEALDVQGTVASTGRRGRYDKDCGQSLKADGLWQDLAMNLQGCQGFEVMAGAGRQGSGHFSLLHAVALSAYGPGTGPLAWLKRGRGIRKTQAWWGRRCDRLELRWFVKEKSDEHGKKDEKGRYRLQIRSGCNFGDKELITVHLTQLWFDEHMRGRPSGAPPGAPPGEEP